MGTRLPIGLRWTLRFTAVMMLVVSGMDYWQYETIRRRMRADELLVIELQVDEIAESARRHLTLNNRLDSLERYIDQHLASADPELELGIRVLDPQQRMLVERGSFRRFEIHPSSRLSLQEGPNTLYEVDVGERYPFIVVAAPISEGTVEVAISSRRFQKSVAAVRDRFLLSIPITFVLAGLSGWWLARRSLSPLAGITRVARRISASENQEEIPVSGTGDEIDRLADTLNEMMRRLRRGVEQVRSFSSNAAHQLRTPVSRLQSRLELARSAARDPRADQRLIESALGDVARIVEAIGGMLRLAESEGGIRPQCRQTVDLGALLRNVVEFFEPSADEKTLSLRVSEIRSVSVSGDPVWLNELFSNLLDNAIKYTPPGGVINVRLAHEDGLACVEIRDTGHGISPEEATRVFDRFQRSDSPGRPSGFGLGLTLAREIAQAHGGSIDLASTPGRGSIFTTRLPSSSEGSQKFQSPRHAG